MKASGSDLGDGPVPEAPKVDADRLRRPSSPPTGLKPVADELRHMPPFGSPKRGGQHEQTRRNTGGDARSQVDPRHGGTGARAPRQGRWGDRSPLWLRGYMDGAALLATIPPLAALREARLNGFPGARAVVRRHGIGGSRRRVSDTSPTGSLDAAKGGKPAYPLSYNGAGEGMAPAPPSNPPRVALPWRSRLGAPPPSPAPVRRDARAPHRRRHRPRIGDRVRRLAGQSRSRRRAPVGAHPASHGPYSDLDGPRGRGRARAHPGGRPHRQQPQPDRSVGKHPQGVGRGRRGDRPPCRHRAGPHGACSLREPGLRCTLSSWRTGPARPARRLATCWGSGTPPGSRARASRCCAGTRTWWPRWPIRSTSSTGTRPA